MLRRDGTRVETGRRGGRGGDRLRARELRERDGPEKAVRLAPAAQVQQRRQADALRETRALQNRGRTPLNSVRPLARPALRGIVRMRKRERPCLVLFRFRGVRARLGSVAGAQRWRWKRNTKISTTTAQK